MLGLRVLSIPWVVSGCALTLINLVLIDFGLVCGVRLFVLGFSY